MSAFQQQYKSKPTKFIDWRGGRNIRAVEHEESRKKQRADVINGNRNISNGSANIVQQEEPQQPISNKETRRLRLQSWKAERDLRKKMNLLKKKRPFLTGIVHHKLYSPIPHNDNAAGTSKQQQKARTPVVPAPPPKRITRATEKRLLNKVSRIVTKSSNLTGSKEQKNRKKQQSIAPSNHKFKPPAGLHCMQLFGRVDPQSMSPLRLSEIISTSRTRGASRKGESIGLYEAPLTKKEMDIDNAEESSESIRLKLSSDEDEQPTSSRNSSKNASTIARSSSKAEAENEVIDNNSPVELPSISNNTTTTPSPTEPTEPAFFSPYIVSSRGKSNARKEQQLRRGFSIGPSPGSDIPTKDTVMKSLNISIEDEERTAQYFQFLLNREIKRLNELCEEWAVIKEEPTITEDAQYLIHQAIGQTNLLICKKFERFRRLVTDCETGKGEMLVTCKDLQGFWDMMYMEIKDCDTRFEKLEKLRTQGWKEDEPPVSKPIAKKKVTVRKKKVVSTKPSSLRAFLREKKKMSQETKDEDDTGGLNVINDGTLSSNSDKIENSPSVKYRTRSTSGSIGLDNKRFSPSNSGRLKSNLLLKVQLSDRERMRSPLTVIKVSQMCKTPDIQLDNSIYYINSDQTPMKSILKPSKNVAEENSSKKSTYTVNFDDHVSLNEVPVDEEVQTKLDLASALARIDSFDLDSNDEEVPFNSAKQLNFDDSSSEEDENDHDAKEHSGLKNSVGDSTSQSTLHRRRLRRQDAFNESNNTTDNISPVNTTPSVPVTKIKDNAELDALKHELGKYSPINEEEEEATDLHNESVRVLRNRSIIQTNDKPVNKRRSLRKVSMKVLESEQKENKTPSKTRSKAKRKSSLNVKSKDNENKKSELESAMDNMDLNENSDKRRHSRRSVKFSEKECSGCIESKQVLPMTPHATASSRRLQSTEKKRKNKLSEDLISWETPEKLPARVRRSQNRRVSSSLI